MIFDKPLEKIQEEDIERLCKDEVEEGILLDYKSDWIENKKLAKAIASFANTHGGHLIIGVGADKKKNVPVSLVGIPEVDGLKERVANICMSRIHPLPFFRMKLVSLKREPGRCVLVIEIPESFEPPHYVNGVIYVRNGESSAPVEILKNHFIIEKLYEKRESGEERTAALVENRGYGENFDKADYSLTLITCPSIPGRVPLPLYRRPFYQCIKRIWGYPLEQIDRSSLRLRNRSRWKERYAEICVNGLIEQGRGVCFPERSRDLIQGTKVLKDEFPRMLRGALEVYKHPLVQYYGRLRLILTLNGTAGRFLNIEGQPNGPPNGCLDDSVRLERGATVYELEAEDFVHEWIASFERELLRAFGEVAFEPEGD